MLCEFWTASFSLVVWFWVFLETSRLLLGPLLQPSDLVRSWNLRRKQKAFDISRLDKKTGTIQIVKANFAFAKDHCTASTLLQCGMENEKPYATGKLSTNADAGSFQNYVPGVCGLAWASLTYFEMGMPMPDIACFILSHCFVFGLLDLVCCGCCSGLGFCLSNASKVLTNDAD